MFPARQGQGQPHQGPGENQHSSKLATHPVAPSKRPTCEDDDELQFVSEKPVKKRKLSEKPTGLPNASSHAMAPAPVPYAPMHPAIMAPVPMPPAVMPHVQMHPSQMRPTPMHPQPSFMLPPSTPMMSTPAPSMAAPSTQFTVDGNNSHETERRLSTGMVGLPSDFNPLELTYALRGVSMPVLENFVLNQPSRQPRPSSPPELSPKQLPSTISPAMLDVQRNQLTADAHHLPVMAKTSETQDHNHHCHSNEGVPATSKTPLKTTVNSSNVNNLNTSADARPTQQSDGPGISSTLMPPPPLPRPEPQKEQRTRAESTIYCANSSHPHDRGNSQKPPCQACSRLRQQQAAQAQTQISRTQAIPVNKHMTPQMMSYMHCNHPYGQPWSPQMLAAMSANNMPGFGQGFNPFMMPMGGNTFAALPSAMTSQMHHQMQLPGMMQQTQTPPPAQQQQISPQQPQDVTNDKHTSSHPASNVSSQPPQAQDLHAGQSSTTNNAINQTSNTPMPAPAAPSALGTTKNPQTKYTTSQFQPTTYRKPSPNLIVDISETCQEKFPFEEVAKRHNVPVEKVHDVFSAIIQVPLLRCPTDRRRPGKLGTARVKEYVRAKKDIAEARGGTDAGGQGGGGEQGATEVTTGDVASRLGTVEFPRGFNLEGH